MATLNSKPNQGAKEVLTRSEVLDLFQISSPTLLEWQRKSILKGIKVGRRVFFDKAEIDALFNSNNVHDARK